MLVHFEKFGIAAVFALALCVILVSFVKILARARVPLWLQCIVGVLRVEVLLSRELNGTLFGVVLIGLIIPNDEVQLLSNTQQNRVVDQHQIGLAIYLSLYRSHILQY